MRPPRLRLFAPRLALGLTLAGGVACKTAPATTPPTPTTAPAAPQKPQADAPHALDHFVRIFDAQGQEHTMASLLDALAEHRVVLLGETHIDDTTHRVEHAVLEGLADRHDDRVVLSLEMFSRDVQPVIDQYLAGEIGEAAMLEQSRPWPNYRTGYRPLVETAKSRSLPVKAANTPGRTMMKATRGAEAYAEVRKEHPEWLPPEVLPASDEYWDRVDRTIRGHGPPRTKDRTYSVQNLWDNTMAHTIVEAAQAHPEHRVLHVVGGFHVENHDGTTAQVKKRAPDLDVVTMTVRPTSDLSRVGPDPERADFVVYAQSYAEGPSGGQLSVTVPQSLHYRLHVPSGEAPAEGWPLLVWLADDERRTDDATLRWRMALGREAAVIVVEPPHLTRARAGWLVRRWAWPESLTSDLSSAASGVARIVEYARRRLPVKAQPVLVAGEGAGGTVALWAAQYGQGWEGIRITAIDPQWPRALRQAAIPDDPSGVEVLELLGPAEDDNLVGLRGVGLTPKVAPAPAPGGARNTAVRAALGLGAAEGATAKTTSADPTAPMARAGQPLEVVVEEPSGLSTHWAELYTSLLVARGHDARLRIGTKAAASKGPTLAFDGGPSPRGVQLLDVFAEGKGLPKTPDVFGGAVVMLLPRGTNRGDDKRWAKILTELEAGQGFIKTPYRVVREGDTKGIAAVMDELRGKGRTEVLVVPVELCATAERMQRYFARVEGSAAGISLHWLPGLGHHVVAHLLAQ